uniref:Rapsyn_N domain-containing protein n=1 Tax=Heterorhabditis bacteriophora TaxID=37862 RepID=A0A1I7WXL5_HETBA
MNTYVLFEPQYFYIHSLGHLDVTFYVTDKPGLLQNAEDRFITLGYLAQAFCDSGEYETMLHYALQQMELANERRDEYMKSEAFLNLAKGYERLADFSKALSYGKASLQHPSMDPRTPGYAHLERYLRHNCLEAFEQSMNVANETGDKLLELQICVGLGSLFTLLRDLTKALIFLRNAMAIVHSVTVDDVHAKYRCTILYHLSVALRIRGSLVDAKEACDLIYGHIKIKEASQLAAETNNRALQARCMCSLADIYRELGESEAKETITVGHFYCVSSQIPSHVFGGIKTPLVEAADELKEVEPQATLTRRTKMPFRSAEKDIDQLNRTLDRIEKGESGTLKKHKNHLHRRGNHAVQKYEGLPPSAIIALPPPMPLSETGPLVFSRAPTITDV